MLGLKTKAYLAIIVGVVVASASIVAFSYVKSSSELKAAVDTGNLDLVHTVAAEIQTINEREFKMLESVANLSLIRDAEVDMHDKWELANSATGGSNKYFGLGFFNAEGIGYATTGRWSDLHTRYYLVESMKGLRALQDPDFSPVNGHLCSYYAVPVRDANGRQIAEISAVVDATDLCRTVSGINVGRNSHPFVLSRLSGKYVAHEDQQLVADGVIAEDVVSEGLRPIIQKIKNGETGTEIFYDEVAKARYSVAYQPIDGSNWSAVCLAPYSDFYSGIGELLRVTLIIAVISLVVAFFIGFLVINAAVSPLGKIGTAIDGIASGDADLTVRLEADSKDEVGMLVDGFNKFTEKLQVIISELKDSKGDLHAYGERLGGMVQENAEFITKMLENIKSVNKEIANQHEMVGSTVTAVNGISSAVEVLRSLLQTQENGIETASSAVTQMIGNIGAVSNSVDKMADEFKNLEGSLNDGINRQHEVNSQVVQIESQSKMLNEANTVISSIASQTNLLAMNAAIEAAHAGEAGKGFAVVADEIRKLSENSSSQSKNISNQIKVIMTSIESVVSSSALADRALTQVVEKIQETGNLVEQIKLAMEEQNEGSKQIGDALNNMNGSTGQVRDASDDVDSSRKGIMADVRMLEESSNTVKSLVGKMEAGVKHIEEDDDSLMNIATSINGTIYRIGTQIDQFKV